MIFSANLELVCRSCDSTDDIELAEAWFGYICTNCGGYEIELQRKEQEFDLQRVRHTTEVKDEKD